MNGAVGNAAKQVRAFAHPVAKPGQVSGGLLGGLLHAQPGGVDVFPHFASQRAAHGIGVVPCLE